MEFLNLFLIGAVYGFTTCSLTCLPYLAPYMMGKGGGFMGGVRRSAWFVVGKAAAYGMVGGAAAWAGHNVFRGREPQLAVVTGVALAVVGLFLLLAKDKGGCSSGTRAVAHKGRFGQGQPFLLGFFTSLIPCAPLTSLILMAAGSGSAVSGSLYGLVYGGGIILSPLILAGGFFGFIAERIRVEMPDMRGMLRTTAASVLIVSGLLAALKPLWA